MTNHQLDTGVNYLFHSREILSHFNSYHLTFTTYPPSSDMPSHFFRIPRELRDRIYELLLLHHEPINKNQRRTITPALFRVNKIINHEAIPLFYSRNHFDFKFDTPETVASFLAQIGRENSDSIRHIRIANSPTKTTLAR